MIAKRELAGLSAAVLLAAVAGTGSGARAAAAYPEMAPVARYPMADRNAEIAMARSAAPSALSDHATVLVLGGRGYETAAKGDNGFT